MVMLSAALHAFALGQLCGLVIRRGITAGVVALLLMFLVFMPQAALAEAKMVPFWSLAIVPAMLLAISWGWSGDWMLDRDGPRRWVRLALLVIVPFGLLGTGYVAYRAWGVPDVPSPYAGSDALPEPIPPDQDAAEGYRAAIAKIKRPGGVAWQSLQQRIDTVIAWCWEPSDWRVIDYWRKNREAIELTRQASARPRDRFPNPPSRTLFRRIDPAVTRTRELMELLALDARERQSRGDLAGAWEDIRAGFRIAEVVATSAMIGPDDEDLRDRPGRSRLAISWACDPQQTADSLRPALDDLRRLPPLPSLEDALKREALAEERAIDLPLEELQTRSNLFGRPSFATSLLTMVTVNPWERERARRVLRLLMTDELELARSESWQYWRRGDRPAFARGLARPDGPRAGDVPQSSS